MYNFPPLQRNSNLTYNLLHHSTEPNRRNVIFTRPAEGYVIVYVCHYCLPTLGIITTYLNSENQESMFSSSGINCHTILDEVQTSFESISQQVDDILAMIHMPMQHLSSPYALPLIPSQWD